MQSAFLTSHGLRISDTHVTALSEFCPTLAPGVVEEAAMIWTQIIILPVICMKGSGLDLTRQHLSQGRGGNVVELRRARLNRAFERLNRLLEGCPPRPLSNKPLRNQVWTQQQPIGTKSADQSRISAARHSMLEASGSQAQLGHRWSQTHSDEHWRAAQERSVRPLVSPVPRHPRDGAANTLRFTRWPSRAGVPGQK